MCVCLWTKFCGKPTNSRLSLEWLVIILLNNNIK